VRTRQLKPGRVKGCFGAAVVAVGGAVTRPPFFPFLPLPPRPFLVPEKPGIRFIIFCISLNCFTSCATSPGSEPEPLAMRARREPSMSSTSARSTGVIDRMMASTRAS